MTARILILTEPGDETAERVARLLVERGAEIIEFEPAHFPVHAQMTVSLSPEGSVRRLLVGQGTRIDLSGLTAAWFRRPNPPAPHPHIGDEQIRSLVATDCDAFAASFWDSLECRLVPGPRFIWRRADQKLYELVEAARIGFSLPATLITTDADEFLDFYCDHDGRIITKTITPMVVRGEDGFLLRYTELVSTRDVGHAEAMRLCPVIVQAYVPKAIEVRVTVVGSRVFAAEIHSQESNHARYDWRRYDLRLTPHRVHRLPDMVAGQCVELVGRLGLCYGAIDLILTPDGRYVFLEVNSNGEYAWIEEMTGLPISEAMADLLLGVGAALPAGGIL